MKFLKLLLCKSGSVPSLAKKASFCLFALLWVVGDLMAQSKPNFVWILSEDNSKHFLELFDSSGAEVPALTALAEEGLTFTNAFCNGPVCSPARSNLISGCYGSRIGASFHKREVPPPMPNNLEMFPAYLRKHGYYTTNNNKEDFNIIRSDGVWDHSSSSATWRNRAPGQPFFHMQTWVYSHEGYMQFQNTNKTPQANPDSMYIPPMHPNTELFRYSYARYHDKMQDVGNFVQDIIDQLEDDGLLENTFVFYFSDNGGVLPGSKGYAFETGLGVPLIVRIPENYRDSFPYAPGSSTDGFVSFIDFAPTILQLAGIDIPVEIDGTPFLGKNITKKEIEARETTFGFVDRCDEKIDMVRTYRKGRFKYTRNYQPFNYEGLFNQYRYRMLAWKEWHELYLAGQLDENQRAFFEFKAPEALYDLENDPYEVNNLAEKVGYDSILQSMRNTLSDFVKGQPDLGFYPEHYLIENAFDNPVAFGLNNQAQIAAMVDIADLSLYPFESIADQLAKALDSDYAWNRYWALIVCSTHLNDSSYFVDKARELATQDPERLVRVRAAEYLALIGSKTSGKVLLDALVETKDPIEATTILNSITMLSDGYTGLQFKIPLDQIDSALAYHKHVKNRLNYLVAKQVDSSNCVLGDSLRPCPSITLAELINTDTGKRVKILQDGDTLSLQETGSRNLAIQIVPYDPRVQSVAIDLNGENVTHASVRSQAPFSSFGNNRDKIQGQELAFGYKTPLVYTLKSKSFSETEAQGTPLDSLILNFYLYTDIPRTFVFEAECAEGGTDWTPILDSGASGNQYLAYLGEKNDNLDLMGPKDTSDKAVLRFEVDVPEKGEYHLFMRALQGKSQYNSFWIRCNQDKWWNWSEGFLGHSDYFWNLLEANSLMNPVLFEKGKSLIEIAYRDTGAGFDKLFLSQEKSLPQGKGAISLDTCLRVDSTLLHNPEQAFRIQKAYPNPLEESKLNLELSKAIFGKTDIMIYNLYGHEVFRFQQYLDNPVRVLEIDLASMPLKKGTYLVSLLGEGYSLTPIKILVL